MLIRNPKAFTRGMLLLLSFIAVFVVFFLPVFPGSETGAKTNGLVYADHLFNTLSKGSANFFDATLQKESSVDKRAEEAKGKTVDVTVPFKAEDKKQMEALALSDSLLKGLGFESSVSGNSLKMKGDLYVLLKAMIADSWSFYENKPEEVSARRGGADGKAVMQAWWNLGTNMIKPMQRVNQNAEASVVSNTISKGIEPAYNFFGITPLRVSDNIPLVAGFLIFYVIYTMWYGFAIFELFEGIGLSMKKSVKSET